MIRSGSPSGSEIVGQHVDRRRLAVADRRPVIIRDRRPVHRPEIEGGKAAAEGQRCDHAERRTDRDPAAWLRPLALPALGGLCLERSQQFPARLEAARGVLLEQLLDRGRDLRRRLGREAAHRQGLVLRDLAAECDQRLAREGVAAGQHLVQRGTEGEQIRAGVRALAADLLGRHVAGRAQHLPVLGELRRLRLVDHRDAEVGELRGQKIARQQDVAGLDVAMDATVGVGVVERHGERFGGRHRLGGRQATALLEQPGQRGPLDQLHVDERFRRALDVVDDHDVGMVERAGGARFAKEAVQDLAIAAPCLLQDLERDVAVVALIVGLVDARHGAFAEQALDPVAPEGTLRTHSERLFFVSRLGATLDAQIAEFKPQLRSRPSWRARLPGQPIHIDRDYS